jgi:hypothetical protein
VVIEARRLEQEPQRPHNVEELVVALLEAREDIQDFIERQQRIIEALTE